MARRKNYCAEDIEKALEEIQSNKMSIHEAARIYKIPRGTLQNRLRGRSKSSSYGPNPVLTQQEEEKLADWIKNSEKRGFPRRKLDIKLSVKEFLERRPRENPFKENLPGETWFKGFLKRHPEIAERTPEGITDTTSKVSESHIRKWFIQIGEYLNANNYSNILKDANRVYSGDLTNFQKCPQSGEVIASKDTRNVNEADTGQAKENFTVMLTFSAAGLIVPPMIIYPYKRIPQAILKFIPDEIIYQKSDNGWMTSEVFHYYVKEVFHPFLVQQNVEFPVILFVDSHRTHMAYSVSKLCEELKIILICLYPNSTRIPQAADVAAFRPLQMGWQNAILEWRAMQIDAKLTKSIFAPLLLNVVQKHIKKEYIINGFRTCGLYPFDVNAVAYTKCLGKSTAGRSIKAEQRLRISSQAQTNYKMDFAAFKTYVGPLNMERFENFEQNTQTVSEHFLILYQMYKQFTEGSGIDEDYISYEYLLEEEEEPEISPEFILPDEPRINQGISSNAEPPRTFMPLPSLLSSSPNISTASKPTITQWMSSRDKPSTSRGIDPLNPPRSLKLSIDNFLPKPITPQSLGAKHVGRTSLTISSSPYQKQMQEKLSKKKQKKSVC